LEAGGGKTAVCAVAASVLFNANTGSHTVESKTPLQPLDVTIEEPSRIIRVKGNILTVSQSFGSNRELTEVVEGVYFGIPVLLAVEFADPPVIERVEGTIGGVTFRWELRHWRAEFRVTTQDEQERAVASSWERIGLLSALGSRRLLAALHFFYVAVRLTRQGTIAGEFLAEMILNLSKVLEVLFPAGGNVRSLDAARQGLKTLGFSETEIEADYIPAIALRNAIDVGHVSLSLFTPEQLTLIHGYVGRAEGAYRTLLHRVLKKIESGEFALEPYEPTSARGQAVAVIEKMRQYTDRYAL
jgi:hypothetical protein